MNKTDGKTHSLKTKLIPNRLSKKLARFQIIRTVTENSRTLKFTDAGFEEE
jgi:hypothetical protein